MGAALPLPSPQPVDGKYALIRRLGSGGSATVWEAEHLLAGKRVALKQLDPVLARDHRLRTRFVADARSAARIAHVNVVDIYDLGVARDGACYMVMELLQGETLADVIDERGPLAPGYACELMLQVLAGVAAAHEHGIVHRDLKPANVVITHPRPDRPHVKVLDFGIATGLVGTPAYMAPEQVLGQPVDARTDIYAAGAMLFEALTGAPPVEGSTAETLAPHVPAGLAAIVLRALARDPAERPPSAADLARRLAPYALTLPSWAAPAVASAPIPLLASPVVAVRIDTSVLADDFSDIELGPLGARQPPAPPATESLLRHPLPAPPHSPLDWGVSGSGVPSSLPGRAPGATSTPSEYMARRASTLPPRVSSRAASLKSALVATLAGFGTGLALAWLGGLI
jgi:serine/threonine protein kinase